MSAKRFASLSVLIVLLAFALVGGGCATTSSQNAQYKPHKPQMITAEGAEFVGDDSDSPLHVLGHGFKLSDKSARALTALGRLWIPSGSAPYYPRPE
jgi:hypothetical protein